ncbi:hypothetical protein FN846DRAFT_935590 [Sphaerosporella brunnea]|uniref:Uncharacterized protein n=1 Tax=Sphaerosporella brunnea TaxID=1250544 RepID=A0A5J5F5F1_9PEZI|nr:hypothetical protein FN846DRAFT_935590 [Sphaerosporella brunnea]
MASSSSSSASFFESFGAGLGLHSTSGLTPLLFHFASPTRASRFHFLSAVSASSFSPSPGDVEYHLHLNPHPMRPRLHRPAHIRMRRLHTLCHPWPPHMIVATFCVVLPLGGIWAAARQHRHGGKRWNVLAAVFARIGRRRGERRARQLHGEAGD